MSLLPISGIHPICRSQPAGGACLRAPSRLQVAGSLPCGTGNRPPLRLKIPAVKDLLFLLIDPEFQSSIFCGFLKMCQSYSYSGDPDEQVYDSLALDDWVCLLALLWG